MSWREIIGDVIGFIAIFGCGYMLYMIGYGLGL